MKVSVLVPVYNLERFVLPCLESLLAQETDFDFEVIAVDDCSPDNSYALMLELASREPRLKVYHNEQNQGLAKTQKRLLSLASGEYLAYLDGDDLALPGKLQLQADYLDRHPSCSLCYHESEMFDDESGRFIKHFTADYYNARYLSNVAGVEQLISYGASVNASSIMFRRHPNLADAIDEGCKIILDHPWHILILCLGGGTLDFIPEVLGRYRAHANSFGAQTSRSSARREQSLADLIRACDNAVNYGVDALLVAKGRAHHYYSAALYFLFRNDDVRFVELLERARSTLPVTSQDWYFDARHRFAFEHRQDADAVRRFLKAGTQ
ncbi:glycosyl transferase [Pokkaliibacter plantistimulans]|uniref:Glycosyl transferase n=1 Tax=Pokkaliibacter plantistimulans TaxID=1635171 RepID=A0ABX5M1M0_9GAMM|nr:glycosyltransferase [Pokkaliibacter plantistimulans]PXF32386.1 glycosyl transferase [Pokkaliibacter plantistimulans]